MFYFKVLENAVSSLPWLENKRLEDEKERKQTEKEMVNNPSKGFGKEIVNSSRGFGQPNESATANVKQYQSGMMVLL